MADHFIGIDRGKDGFKFADFTFGTASTAARDFEFRIADLDSGGVASKRKDAIIALEAIIRSLQQGGLQSTFPKL